VLSHIQAAWENLIRPAQDTGDIEKRQRSQLVAALLMVFMAVAATIAVVALLGIPGQFASENPLAEMLVALAGLACAYALNRRGYSYVSAWILVSITWVIPCWSVLLAPDLHSLVYLGLPVLLAMLLLPLRQAHYVTLTCLSTIVIWMALDGHFTISELLFSPFILIAAIHVVFWLTLRYQQAWEQERRARVAESENSYRQLVQFSPNPVLVHHDGNIIFMNTAGAELLGARAAKELIGRATLEFIHPEQRQTAEHLLREAETLKTVFRFVEQQLVRLDGSIVEVDTAIIPIVYQGKPALQISYRNIDRHKQQEAAERSRRKLAEAMRDTATALTSTLDLEEVFDHILRYTNIVPHDAACIMVVRDDRACVIRKHGYEDLPADFSMSIHTTPSLQRMIHTHSPVLFRDTLADPTWILFSGTEWIRSHISAPIMNGGRVVGFISLDSAQPGAFQPEHCEQLRLFAEQAAIALQNAALYDKLSQHVNQLEERVQMRTAELLAAKERVETILHHSSDAVILLNSEGNIQQANPAFREFFGRSADDVFNMPFTALLDTDQRAEIQQAIQETVERGINPRLELRAPRQDGSNLIVDAVFACVAGRDRHPPAVVCSLRDITARKRTEEELRKALEKERQLSEMTRQFTTSVSHEFRNPLATILSSSELMLHYGQRMTETQKLHHLETVQEQVRLITQILDDLMANGEARSIHLYPQPDSEI
jgi:PAS domain S-box-containing protein